MLNGTIISVGIPIQGEKDGRLWKVGEAEIEGNLFLVTMDDAWTEILTDLVKNGAEIEGIVIDVRFVPAKKDE